jgi:TonB-linked SusC/RagA family outer membrane protein
MYKKKLNFILFIVLFAVNQLFAQTPKIDLSLRDATLKEFINAVEQKTDYTFMLDNSIDQSQRISVQVRQETIYALLQKVLTGKGLTFEIANRQILLKVRPETGSNQTAKRITGTVIDQAGEPVIGASVLEKGAAANGTVTDTDGNFSLTVADNAVLKVSYIGYVTQEISVSSANNSGKRLIIKLMEDTQALEEIVVIGYGTAKRRDLTGAISSIASEQIVKVPVTNIGQAMQGRMSGVQVTNNDGAPGASVQVQIRGIGSFGDNTPLYVVDGYPGANISSINPQDIQSIDVLKDASAAAIYGNRAANGVVIITTKRGEEGQIQTSFDATTSVQFKPQPYNMLNSQEFVGLAMEVATRENSPVLAEWSNPAGLRTIDWQDVMYRSGLKQNYNLSLRGGTEKSLTSVSLGMMKHKGIVEFSDYNRYNTAFTHDYKPVKWLRSSTTARYAYTDEKVLFGSGQGGVGRLAKLIPTMTANPLTDLPDDGNGNYGYYSKTENAVRDNENVYARSKLNDQKNVHHNLTATTAIEIYPINGLTLKTNFGVSYGASSGYNFHPYDDRVPTTRKATYRQYASNSFEYLWENTANYSRTFDRHALDLLAGISIQENTARDINAEGEGVMSDGLRNLASMENIRSIAGYQQTWSLASYFGRVTYKFDERYILTATVRRDGSSRFASGNRWGTFPSVSAAWRVKEESFLKELDAVSNLKFRASYGEAGNQNIGLF